MVHPIGMGLQAGSQALRFGWYFALKQAIDWRTSRLEPRSEPAEARPRPEQLKRPAPTEREILADLAGLFLRDAMAVRDGIFPALTDAGSPFGSLQRAREMLADVPDNWLDSLLTGERSVIGEPPYTGNDIARLLKAVRERMTARINKLTAQRSRNA